VKTVVVVILVVFQQLKESFQ